MSIQPSSWRISFDAKAYQFELSCSGAILRAFERRWLPLESGFLRECTLAASSEG
jgi:hypothetical protein